MARLMFVKSGMRQTGLVSLRAPKEREQFGEDQHGEGVGAGQLLGFRFQDRRDKRRTKRPR